MFMMQTLEKPEKIQKGKKYIRSELVVLQQLQFLVFFVACEGNYTEKNSYLLTC